MAEPIEEDKWGPVKVPEAVKKALVKEILTTGIIDRDQYPDLWPEKRLITIKWPDETDKRPETGEQTGAPGLAGG